MRKRCAVIVLIAAIAVTAQAQPRQVRTPKLDRLTRIQAVGPYLGVNKDKELILFGEDGKKVAQFSDLGAITWDSGRILVAFRLGPPENRKGTYAAWKPGARTPEWTLVGPFPEGPYPRVSIGGIWDDELIIGVDRRVLRLNIRDGSIVQERLIEGFQASVQIAVGRVLVGNGEHETYSLNPRNLERGTRTYWDATHRFIIGGRALGHGSLGWRVRQLDVQTGKLVEPGELFGDRRTALFGPPSAGLVAAQGFLFGPGPGTNILTEYLASFDLQTGAMKWRVAMDPGDGVIGGSWIAVFSLKPSPRRNLLEFRRMTDGKLLSSRPAQIGDYHGMARFGRTVAILEDGKMRWYR